MTRHELTVETLTEMWRPTEVQLSPDGRRVAWAAAPYAAEGEDNESGIWVSPFDGSKPARRWTFGGEDRSPRWSPDGQWLAFLSDRTKRGRSDVYVMSVEGGEAMPLVVRERAATAIAWSPDSRRVAFLAPGDLDDEDRRREQERDDAEVFGTHWTPNRLWTVEVDSKEVTAFEHGEGHAVALDWSPDGAMIALLVRPTPELDATGAGHIRLVDANGAGLVGDVCAAAGAEKLCFTAAGRIAFVAFHEPNVVSARTARSVAAKPGAAPSTVAPSDDEAACGLDVCSLGEDGLIVMIAEGLDSRLERVEAESGRRAASWTASGDIACFDCGPGGRMVVAYHEKAGPLEVWAGVDGDLRRLSDHHRALGGLALGEVVDFEFETEDGLKLDGILIRPGGAAGTAGPWPTVVLPHGGPYARSGRELHVRPSAWGQWLAVGGYAVLMPNYRGGAGRGQAFAAAARGDMGGGEWLDILAAVDAAIERGIADPERLGIGGWSQGGFLSAWAVTQTDRFKAAVVGAGVTDWTMLSLTSDLPSFESTLAGGAPWDALTRRFADERSPLVQAGAITTPVLLLHGQEDERIPHSQAMSLHRALRLRGVPVELVSYPREPHRVRERRHQADILRRVRAWYDRWLKT